ncbi:UDP-N-acetylglucosamine--peptide N-acetylglucosaminyltransferase GtfA subunit [Paraburkholderia nemoris]|uniref:glycosyltransferase n=1 Tax=Paraburkholderia nemoris TaxID=2793076 RepID=UPI001909B653|nr:glycosyltransferase [Paraburkholderia nemoris]MBK3740874.1 glycosyltransferase family 4 protein [Paraburkholderia aspalathi]CAE6728642.1 UDP-N-acetylglucosamine--peptide N-acetylglucosaminyltransferase GtfA subunit [Paraburkholderia nemoris]
MKIVIAVPDIGFKGGAEQVALDTATALSKFHDVTILSLFSSGHDSRLMNGVDVVHLNIYRPISILEKIRTRLRISNFIRHELNDVDVLIGNNFFRYWAFPPFVGGSICVEVQHLRYEEDRHHWLRMFLRNWLYRWLDGVVVLTERDRALFIKNNVADVSVIYNMVPFSEKINNRMRPKIVVAVGRLSAQKNFGELIEAWVGVREKLNDWNLVIYGEGEQRPFLEALILEKGLRECVFIPGYRENKSAMYASGSIFCSVSKYEGFSLAACEAAAHGTPIVSFDYSSGPAELYAMGAVAKLVPSGDRRLLAMALCELAENDELRQQCGERAQSAAQVFSAEAFAKRWLQYVERLGMSKKAFRRKSVPT